MVNKRIVLIGAGNVAHHLGQALLKSGLNLCQIYSRTLESARALGMKTGISYTADIYAIYPDCDIYIFCVSDDALVPVFKGIRMNKEATVLHTSGSMPMQVFQPYRENFGVLYPLQTFSKKRALDFREVPLCIEASNPDTLKQLRKLGHELSESVYEVTSENRKKLHLAAVFANNFTNHLYEMAARLLKDSDMDFALLRPLIFETAHKVMLFTPEEAQTGPARRNDEGILSMHRAMLKNDKKLLQLYTLLSDSIKETYTRVESEQQKEDRQMSLNLW